MAMNVGWLRGAEGLVLKSVARIFSLGGCTNQYIRPDY